NVFTRATHLLTPRPRHHFDW
ncbi:type II/IV secretion system family protein, partial [Vibrio parahaemolyticus V-223/04]